MPGMTGQTMTGEEEVVEEEEVEGIETGGDQGVVVGLEAGETGLAVVEEETEVEIEDEREVTPGRSIAGDADTALTGLMVPETERIEESENCKSYPSVVQIFI